MHGNLIGCIFGLLEGSNSADNDNRNNNIMTNAQINESFLCSLAGKTTNLILANIANHYGITPDEVMDEITHEDAENILDYVTVDRPAVSLYFRMWSRSQKMAA